MSVDLQKFLRGLRLVPLSAGLLLTLSACKEAPRPAAAPPEPVAVPQPPVPECTLATPLVPDVPGSPGHLMPSARNPNGVSELAALMRTMQTELTGVRALVQQGQARPKLRPQFAKIRCSWPTTPADRDTAFDASAQNYLQAVSALDEATPAQAATAFDHVLSACRTCHEHTCSGAIVAIEALRLPKPVEKTP